MFEATEKGGLIAFPSTPEARLRVALRQLDSALAEQRSAIAAFRREMSVLADAVSHLASTTAALQTELDTVAQDNARARSAADLLANTAAEMERHL